MGKVKKIKKKSNLSTHCELKFNPNMVRRQLVSRYDLNLPQNKQPSSLVT